MDAPKQLFGMLLGFEKSMALYCLCKLGIPDILHRAGPDAFLSVQEIARHLASNHVNTTFLAQILDGSTAFGILAGKPDGATGTTCYGLNALSYSLLTVDENPSSLAPMVLLHMHPVAQAPWHHFADSVLTGTHPFTIAHGKNVWGKTEEDGEWNTVFNACMASTSYRIGTSLDKYEGFRDVKTMVDVGGGTGAVMRAVVKKHPHIHGIVFDLPQVIAEARLAPVDEGIDHVEYIAGSMFESVPSGDAIFMKWIMHDWDDERCIQILRNCLKALPEHGKVLLAEAVVLEDEKSSLNEETSTIDLIMLAHGDGGKERTRAQWNQLLGDAGFARTQFVQLLSNVGFEQWIIECYKN